MLCPCCGKDALEIVKEEVDIGVGVQVYIQGGFCADCGEIDHCSNCGGWGLGPPESWHEDDICLQMAKEREER